MHLNILILSPVETCFALFPVATSGKKQLYDISVLWTANSRV
jgi:hypothetical protein